MTDAGFVRRVVVVLDLDDVAASRPYEVGRPPRQVEVAPVSLLVGPAFEVSPVALAGPLVARPAAAPVPPTAFRGVVAEEDASVAEMRPSLPGTATGLGDGLAFSLQTDIAAKRASPAGLLVAPRVPERVSF